MGNAQFCRTDPSFQFSGDQPDMKLVLNEYLMKTSSIGICIK